MSSQPVDDPMPDAVPEDGEDVVDDGPDDNEPIKSGRVRVLPGSSPNAASFEIENEDHTLGNALRWIIMKNPAVEFCGYSIPHPSEPKMNVRIQTYDGSPLEALEKGLDDLMDLCDVVSEKFEDEKERYAAVQRNARA